MIFILDCKNRIHTPHVQKIPYTQLAVSLQVHTYLIEADPPPRKDTYSFAPPLCLSIFQATP